MGLSQIPKNNRYDTVITSSFGNWFGKSKAQVPKQMTPASMGVRRQTVVTKASEFPSTIANVEAKQGKWVINNNTEDYAIEDPNFYSDSFLFQAPTHTLVNYERPDDESAIARFIVKCYGNLGTLSQIANDV